MSCISIMFQLKFSVHCTLCRKFLWKMWIQHDLLANIVVVSAPNAAVRGNLQKELACMTKRMDFLAFRIHQNDILYAFIVRWTSLDILKAYSVFHWVNLHFLSLHILLLADWLAVSLAHSLFLSHFLILLTHAKFNDGNANAYLFSMATNCSHFQAQAMM